MLEVRSLEYSRGDFFCNYSLSATRGRLTLISGANGSGKTTLFYLIAGFLSAHAGEILWQNNIIHNIEAHKRCVSLLFQKNNVFPHLNVERNVALGVSLGRRLDDEQRQRLENALDFFELQDLRHRLPETLSGGQLQRTALARCMLRRHPLVLLDEPLTSLDRKGRYHFIDILQNYIESQNPCVLLVSHEQELFDNIANSNYRIEKGRATKIM